MRKYALFLFFIFFFISSCSLFDNEDKKEKINEGETIQLIDQPNEFSIFEIASFDLNPENFPNGKFEAITLDGHNIPIFIQDNFLTFLVPKLPSGDHKLVFVTKEETFNIPFVISPHTLRADPDQLISNFLNDAEIKIKELENLKSILLGDEKDSFDKDIKSMQHYVQQQISALDQMSEGERLNVAYFIQNNESWLKETGIIADEFSDFLPNARVKNEVIINAEERSERIMKEFVKAKVNVIKNLKNIVALGAMGFLLDGPIIGVAITGLAVIKYTRSFIRLMVSIEGVYDFVKIIEGGDLKANLKANYIFKNGIPTELAVVRDYRNLYHEDENSEVSYVKEFIIGFRELIQGWNELMDIVPLNLSYQPIDLTQNTEFYTEPLRVHSDYLTISDITNPTVTGKSTTDDGKLFLVFNTDKEDAQEFDFTLTYESKDFEGNKKILDAAVINDGCGVILELKDKNKITAIATGYGPFDFKWPGGQEESNKSIEIMAHVAGDFEVISTDQNGCESSAVINIPCTLRIDVLNNLNTYTIEVLDGLPPFSFQWSTGATTNTQTLPPGSHSVTTTDGLGCKIEHSISINCNLEASIQINDGAVQVQASGGLPPYRYEWSNGSNNAFQTGLEPGHYSVTIKDQMGCAITKTVSIDEFAPEYSYFTDGRDGNVYKTVKIGRQTWFAENLRYSKDLKQVPSNEEWKLIWMNEDNLETPAWSYYDNNSNYNTTYGKLYNWYAVNTGLLCPEGWHIPTDEDWNILGIETGTIDGQTFNLMAKIGWADPYNQITNKSGFSAVPSGYRHVDGEFYSFGEVVYFWSSTKTEDITHLDWAIYRHFVRNSVLLRKTQGNVATGMACRCVKNE